MEEGINNYTLKVLRMIKPFPRISLKGTPKTWCIYLKLWKCTTQSDFYYKWWLLLIAMLTYWSSIVTNLHYARHLKKWAAGDRNVLEGNTWNTVSSCIPVFYRLTTSLKKMQSLQKDVNISSRCLVLKKKTVEKRIQCLPRNERIRETHFYNLIAR